ERELDRIADGLIDAVRRFGSPDEDEMHDALIEAYRADNGWPPGGRDPDTGQQVGPSDAEIKYGADYADWLDARTRGRQDVIIKTVGDLTIDRCGTFSWKVAFELPKPAAADGFIIQELTQTVKDGSTTILDQHCWEACWPVARGSKTPSNRGPGEL